MSRSDFAAGTGGAGAATGAGCAGATAATCGVSGTVEAARGSDVVAQPEPRTSARNEPAKTFFSCFIEINFLCHYMTDEHPNRHEQSHPSRCSRRLGGILLRV